MCSLVTFLNSPDYLKFYQSDFSYWTVAKCTNWDNIFRGLMLKKKHKITQQSQNKQKTPNQKPQTQQIAFIALGRQKEQIYLAVG